MYTREKIERLLRKAREDARLDDAAEIALLLNAEDPRTRRDQENWQPIPRVALEALLDEMLAPFGTMPEEQKKRLAAAKKMLDAFTEYEALMADAEPDGFESNAQLPLPLIRQGLEAECIRQSILVGITVPGTPSALDPPAPPRMGQSGRLPDRDGYGPMQAAYDRLSKVYAAPAARELTRLLLHALRLETLTDDALRMRLARLESEQNRQ